MIIPTIETERLVLRAPVLADFAFSCIIDPGNAPSIRVAEKMGFREIARTTYKGSATIVFRRPRP